MAKYIAQVFVVFEATGNHDAADAVSCAMTEILQSTGAIYDWSYCRDGDNYQYSRPVPAGVEIEDEGANLQELYEAAAPVVLI